jgi:NhaA family Na+:H+ antiporter
MTPFRPRRTSRTAFRRGSRLELMRVAEILRTETVGGFLLVAAAIAAVVVANTGFGEAYRQVRDFPIGYQPWQLKLTVAQWAADGLLAVFFFLVGLELKREFVAGDLRSPSRAVVPVAAACGGVAVPALLYAAINAGGPHGGGWAIPTATDIAFAVAVLALIGSHLPGALRLFLLTLAVVDDLIAITIIAVFYTDRLHLAPLLLASIPLLGFAAAVHRFPDFFERRRLAPWLVLLPIGSVFWALVHASGIHATVAGVLLGFTVPVTATRPGGTSLAEVFEHRFRPLSSAVAVPVFAFFSAGVVVGGIDSVAASFTDRVTLGVLAGLVLGKPLGILGGTWLVTRIAGGDTDPEVKWIDVVGVAVLAGIGFTVSLLISELSFGVGSAELDHAKIAVLAASVLASVLAAAILVPRNRHHRGRRYREVGN